MKYYRKDLPPLDTLVFFECAMRHQNFTEAAAELFVSQAAVSKRIQQLEGWLGVQLFERNGRILTPTPVGQHLAERVAMTLEFLDRTIATIKAPAEPSLTIASMSTIAMFWLQPRLRAFALGEDGCAFNLVANDDPAELLREDHDLVLIYGDGNLPGWRTHRVMPERLMPVAAPEVALRLERCDAPVDDPEATPLLDYPRLGPDWIDWTIWAGRTGRADILNRRRILCQSYSQSIGRALRGRGIALGSRPLLDSEIEAGRLCTLWPETLTTGNGYYIAYRADISATPDAERLMGWLLDRSPSASRTGLPSLNRSSC